MAISNKLAPILVIEDHQIQALLMEQALRKTHPDREIVTLSDGQVALDYLSGAQEYADRQRYPLPALIFLDLSLPHRDGFEILERRQEMPEILAIPVVIVSSSEDREAMSRTARLGAQQYFIKPFNADLMTHLLREVSNRWLKPDTTSRWYPEFPRPTSSK